MNPGLDAAALAGKYAALALLRRRRDGAGPAATRHELRDLARAFPGCLRELDGLGLGELERRRDHCAAVATGATPEPWVAWVAAFHAALADALALRAAPDGAPRAEAPDDDLRAVALSPPGGRMIPALLRYLAPRLGTTATVLADTLVPARRPRPYRL